MLIRAGLLGIAVIVGGFVAARNISEGQPELPSVHAGRIRGTVRYACPSVFGDGYVVRDYRGNTWYVEQLQSLPGRPQPSFAEGSEVTVDIPTEFTAAPFDGNAPRYCSLDAIRNFNPLGLTYSVEGTFGMTRTRRAIRPF